MTRAPFVMAKSETAFGRELTAHDTTLGWRFVNPSFSKLHHPYAMGETAENVARKYGITREEQDEFAFNSQRKYHRANEKGRFRSEIVPVFVPSPKATRPCLIPTSSRACPRWKSWPRSSRPSSR